MDQRSFTSLLDHSIACFSQESKIISIVYTKSKPIFFTAFSYYS